MVVPKFLSALSFIDPRRDDDIFDRLSYYYTTILLVLFSVLVSFKQYGGHPLECWMDASFKDSWEEYAENYCWAKNTYFVSMEDNDLPEADQRRQQEISYYQWFPFILLFQAALFYLPCLVWRLANNKSGFNIHHIVERACAHENLDPTKRTANLSLLCEHLNRTLCRKRDLNAPDKPKSHIRGYRYGPTKVGQHRLCKCFNLRFSNAYVSLVYSVVKVMYCFNLLLQLYLLNRFLQTDQEGGLYGFNVVSDLIAGKEWHESGYFPRVTFCDFKIRLLGNVQTHSVQCVLVINIFTEKIFLILWLWFVVLTLATGIATVSWLWYMFSPWGTREFLHRHLEYTPISQLSERQQTKIVRRFYRKHIKQDGLFLLTMIGTHAGTLFCSELVERLWLTYLKKHHIRNVRDLEALPSPSMQEDANFDYVDSAGSIMLDQWESAETSDDEPLDKKERGSDNSNSTQVV